MLQIKITSIMFKTHTV